MKSYPETHQRGLISIESIPPQLAGFDYLMAHGQFEGDLSIQIAKDGRVWINVNGVAFLRFKPGVAVAEQKVYLCLEHCSFFRGEDGCGHNSVDDTSRYEMEGDYPICPLYTED